MSIKDSAFFPIVEQSINELMSIIHGSPKGLVFSYPDLHHNWFERFFAFIDLKSLSPQFIPFDKLKGSSENGNIFIFVPNDSLEIKNAIKIISSIPNYTKKLIIYPIIGFMVQKLIDESNIKEFCEIIEFHLDLLAIESYMYIVSSHRCFRRVFIEGDLEDLSAISKALVKIESLNGAIPNITCIGENSIRVQSLMSEMKSKIGLGAFGAEPVFDTLIIIDRTVDLLTPLLTQFTYNGIIDETLESSFGIIDLPEGCFYDKNRIVLSDQDEVFHDIRGLSIADAGTMVLQNVKEIGIVGSSLSADMKKEFSKNQILKAKSLADRKPLFSLHLGILEFVSALNMQSKYFQPLIRFELECLLGENPSINLLNELMKFDMMWKEQIRYYCIMSMVNDGVGLTQLSSFRKRLVAKYGQEIILEIINMKKAGFMYSSKQNTMFGQKENTFREIVNTFTLLPQDQTEQTRKLFGKEDVGSFYDGYVPLTTRIIQSVLNGDIQKGPKNELLKRLNIPLLFQKTNIPARVSPIKTVMVFVIGGMTSSEAISIREMGKALFQGSIEFVIGTTSLTNSKKFLSDAFPLLK